MCLIIVKKEGDDVTSFLNKSTIEAFNLRNKDGLGFSIKRDNKIYLSKGYFKISNFLKAIKNFNVQKNDELIVHLRKVSVGDKSVINCHPYVCDIDNITQEEGYSKYPVIAHNGTFREYSLMNKSNDTDTILKIKNELVKPNLLNLLYECYKIDPVYAERLIKLDTNKLAIMFPEKPILLLGKWVYEKEHQLWYSNTNYLGDECPTHGKYSFNYGRIYAENFYQRQDNYGKYNIYDEYYGV